MGEESIGQKDEASRMFPDQKKPMALDEELAFFMHKFNLDMETVETMPAFEEHLKPLFPERKKE